MSPIKQAFAKALRDKVYEFEYRWNSISLDRRKKCLIYGNCQMRELSKILAANEVFSRYYQVLPMKKVHTIKQEDVKTLLKCTEKADLFIYQPVKPGYNDSIPELSTDFLKKSLRSDAVTIGVPSLYFSAYSPEIFYAFDRFQKVYKGPADDCQSMFIFAAYIKNLSVNETLNLLSDDKFLDQDLVAKIFDVNISESIRRERDFKLVPASEFIQEHYQEFRLFHTMNHPSNLMMQYMVSALLERLDLIKPNGFNSIISSSKSYNDPFGWMSFSIHPSIYKHLNLNFPYSLNSNILNRNIGSRRLVELFFDFYDKTPSIFEHISVTESRMSETAKLVYSYLT